MLILSLFPGIDLLGKAFEERGFCVVRGPDKLLAQDIRNFAPPPDKFDGIIAGPPCQDFSLLRRTEPTGDGLAMLAEFTRCVLAARPRWWLLENVANVPDVKIDGYSWQRIDINQGWFDEYSRLRHIQFGSTAGALLNVTRRRMKATKGGAALASDRRTVTELLQIQGLPASVNQELQAFTVKARKRVIGNGVPLSIGRELVRSLEILFSRDGLGPEMTSPGGTSAGRRDSAAPKKIISWRNRCRCQCGRLVIGKKRYFSPACRKRAQRRRDREKESHEKTI